MSQTSPITVAGVLLPIPHFCAQNQIEYSSREVESKKSTVAKYDCHLHIYSVPQFFVCIASQRYITGKKFPELDVTIASTVPTFQNIS